MTETNPTTETDETGQIDEQDAPLAELAYTTAREILNGADETLRLEDLLIEPPTGEGETWTVNRSSLGGQVVAEADVFFPHRFKTAQGLAQYLATLAIADRNDWPVYVTGGADEEES